MSRWHTLRATQVTYLLLSFLIGPGEVLMVPLTGEEQAAERRGAQSHFEAELGFLWPFP